MDTSDRRGRGPGKGPRADSVHNRQRIVEGAHAVFLDQGPDAGMREVAARSGVALGTLYRHFPDKQALLEAVVEDRFRYLIDRVGEARAELAPWPAFVRMMRLMAEMMTEDQALAGVLGRGGAARDELDRVLRELAEAAQAAGELRDDVGPADLGVVIGGVGAALMMPRTGDRPPWETYLAVALDGLRATSRGAADD